LGQFQAKMLKYENCAISKTANPIKLKIEDNWLAQYIVVVSQLWIEIEKQQI